MKKSAFAKHLGVSAARVSQWVSTGLIDGEALVGTGRSARIVVEIANAQLRERLDQTRRLVFSESAQAKVDEDHPKGDPLADPEFVSKRTEREGLQAELIRLRLARARGELIPRAAALEAAESAGVAIARSWQALPNWAEELFSACQTGGVTALAVLLRAKANEQCDGIADLLFTPEGEDHDSDEMDLGKED
jgi:hypothetical protein